MPISHKYKLIFIHIPKCAGMSIINSLGLTVNTEDLISETKPALQHLLPKQLKDAFIDKKKWDSYKKFTIIRNPYDRVISDYFWMKGNPDASRLIADNFDNFLALREDVVNGNKYDQDLYFDHFYPMHFYFEEIKYDHVIRFENVEREYEEMRVLYNIINPLPKINESEKKGFVLSKSQQERIYKLYKKDFVKFGYNKFHDAPQCGTSNNMSVIKKIESLKNTEIQIYFADKSGVFSEEKSFHEHVILTNGLIVGFSVDSKYKNTEYIRFDLGEVFGFLIIDSIKIVNAAGKILWMFNTKEVISKQDLLFIESDEYFHKKIIQLSTSNDPQFVVKMPAAFARHFSKGIVVQIAISPICDESLRVLNNSINKSLSFLSQSDFESLRTERTSLSEKLDTANVSLQRLKRNIEKLKREKNKLLSTLGDMVTKDKKRSKN